MSYTSGQIKAPVSIYDVQQALVTSLTDLKTLCYQKNKIKKWARYRPIEFKIGINNYFDILTEAQRASVNYGIGDIPVWRSGKTLGNVINFWLGDDTTMTNRPNDYETGVLPVEWWSMILPTSVARLTDFVCGETPTTKGYYKDAEPPIGQIVSPAIVIASNGGCTIQYPMGLAGATAGLTITYSDLSVLTSHSYEDMSFGVVIVAGNDAYLITQENKVGPGPSSSQAIENDTLWSLGAVVHFSVDDLSICGDIITENNAMIFPVICANSEYPGYDPVSGDPNYITPISKNRQDTYITLLDAVQAPITILYAEGLVTNFGAYKDSAVSTRLIYYSWTIQNPEADIQHTYLVEIMMLDAYGNQLGSTQQRNVTINGGSSEYYDGNIDAKPGGDNYYDTVYALRIVVTVSASLDQAKFKRTNTDAAVVGSSPIH